MGRIRTWLVRFGVALGMAGAAASVAILWTWWASEAHLRSFGPGTRFDVAIPSDAASIAWGKHLAETRGCFGCHGKALEGEVFDDSPWYTFGRSTAPNLPELARRVTPAALEKAIRQGIGHDGRALFAMPSFNFANLSDADTAALIAFLRAAPVAKGAAKPGYLGWAPRWTMATGSDFAIPHFIAQTPLLKRKDDPRPEIRLGEYLAMTSCNECHGFGLRGDSPWAGPSGPPPDLAGARGYSREQFVTLMRTGVPPGGRKLRLMDEVARGRYVHWSEAEVDAIYAYLVELGR